MGLTGNIKSQCCVCFLSRAWYQLSRLIWLRFCASKLVLWVLQRDVVCWRWFVLGLLWILMLYIGMYSLILHFLGFQQHSYLEGLSSRT